MRIEDVLDMSAAQLQAMTPEDLKLHFEPMFPKVRPEFQPPPRMSSPKTQAVVASKQFNTKLEQLKAAGLDMTFLQATRKKYTR